jgi:hypothetical protein
MHLHKTSSFLTFNAWATSLSKSRKEISTRHAVLIAMYYCASIVELATLLCSLLLQMMGDPPTQMTWPVLDFTQ